METGAIKPLGTTPATFERLRALTAEQGAGYGAIVDRLEAAGVKGPDAWRLAAQLAAEGQRLSGETLGSPVPELYARQAAELAQKPTRRGRLGLSQVEAIKRDLQEQARYGNLEQKDTLLNEARKDIASTVREATEQSIASQAALAPEEAAAFVPVKERLGRLIEARDAAERGAARAAQRTGSPWGDFLLASSGAGAGSVTLGTTGAMLGALAPFAARLLKARGPSTMARGAYGLSRGLQAVQGQLPVAMPPALPAPRAQPWNLELLTPPLVAEDEERRRQQALAAAVLGQ